MFCIFVKLLSRGVILINFPDELYRIISGATYSGVPHTLLVVPVRYLDRPKSTILM